MSKLPQPLPESHFKWRRIFSYVAASFLSVLVAYIVSRITEAKELADIAFWLIILLWWIVTYYMVAPSAEQIARIIQSARVMMFGRNDPEE